MRKLFILIITSIILSSCATIVNDPNTPVALSFSDGSDGTCNLTNKEVHGVEKFLELS